MNIKKNFWCPYLSLYFIFIYYISSITFRLLQSTYCAKKGVMQPSSPKTITILPSCFSFFTSCPQARQSIEPIEDVSSASSTCTSSPTPSTPNLLDANKLAELATAALAPGPMPGAYAKMNKELKDVHRRRLRTKTDAPEIKRPKEHQDKPNEPAVPAKSKNSVVPAKPAVPAKSKKDKKDKSEITAEFEKLPMIEACLMLNIIHKDHSLIHYSLCIHYSFIDTHKGTIH